MTPLRRLLSSYWHRLFRPAPHTSAAAAQAYWREPGLHNQPGDYLAPDTYIRSRLILSMVQQWGRLFTPSRILELGCNAGRTLHILQQDGYRNLVGVEINPEAVRESYRAFPNLHAFATIIPTSIEEAILTFIEESFEVIYSIATLEHLHSDSAWVFERLIDLLVVGGILITLEDEAGTSSRHFPRNYADVFLRTHRMDQVFVTACDLVPGLGPGFILRVFRKRDR